MSMGVSADVELKFQVDNDDQNYIKLFLCAQLATRNVGQPGHVAGENK